MKYVPHYLQRICAEIRQIIMPSFCPACKQFTLSHDGVLCQQCISNVHPVVTGTISLTQKRSMPVFAIGDYTGPLKKMILAKGYGGIVVSRQLGAMMWRMTPIAQLDVDYIVPVPLHWTRFAWRGYNQAHEMALALSKYNKVPVAHLVKRIKRTMQQSHFTSKERHANVADVFALSVKDKARYKDKHIVVVDDLMTTGATLRATARMLLPLKPKKISALVVSRST